MFYVYILRSQSSGRFYIGQTQDVTARLDRHNNGGCDATRHKGPWELVYSKAYSSRSEAMIEEARLKRQKSHLMLERLIAETRIDRG